MTDVFDEIADDLRREKLNQFWKENGSWIIGGVIMAVLLTAALSFWRHWEYQRNTAATTELTRLASVSDLPQLESFAKTGSKNHAMIARFVAAGVHLERGEKDQAVALYNEIAATSGIDKTWRGLAQALSIGQRLDRDDPEKLQKEISALSGDEGAWRYTALEFSALLAARQGNMQAAADALTKITADPLAPADARTRAFTLRELYIAGKGGPK
jgi:hypothetical protein